MSVPVDALERALAPAAAVHAAVRAGVLADLVGDGRTPVDVAARHDLDEYRTGVLLGVLADAGVLHRSGGRFRAEPGLPAFAALAAGSLRDLDAALDATRPGVGPRAGIYAQVARPLAHAFEVAARAAARRLAAPHLRVLDLGAGAAPWSIAILRREPTARLTALDLPEVTPVVRRAIAEAGLAYRTTVVDGDLRTARLPAADLVVLAHVLHLFDPEVAAGVVHRASDSSADGGRVAVIEPAADPARGADAARLRCYELGLFTRTGSGRLHDLATVAGWCTDAGLGHIQIHRLPGALPLVLLLARPGASPAGGPP